MRTGRIYKIISGQGDECYVGSTFQSLTYRWRDHKTMYKQYKQGKYKYISSYDLFDKYSIDNCSIILIKEYEVCDRTHMEAYEQLWINKLKSINKQSAFSIKKLSEKQYREQNKDMRAKVNKQWRENNSEILKYKKKQYYEHNKELILEKQRINGHNYYEQNKDKIKENRKQKILCKECNIEICKDSLLRHKKSKTHMMNITKVISQNNTAQI